MKSLLIIFFSLLLSVSVLAQDIKESQLPHAVADSFKKNFTPAGKVLWTKKDNLFTASFKEDKQNTIASFAADGMLAETKTDVLYNELPGSIVTYIATTYKEAKVESSCLRVTPAEGSQYYIVLSKVKAIDVAEFYFDMKGHLLKKNVPASFTTVASATTTVKEATSIAPPQAVIDSFKAKLPTAALQEWKKDSLNYIAIFKKDDMTGRAEFTHDGTWLFTKYTIGENELPGPAVSDVKKRFNEYKIKNCELVSDLSSAENYYYVFAKKEGIDVPTIELYYTLNGKFIKKLTSEDKASNQETENDIKENKAAKTEQNSDSDETISSKELPSTSINYINKAYPDYKIKEAVVSTTNTGTFYKVKLKKVGVTQPVNLLFDYTGKFIPPKDE